MRALSAPRPLSQNHGTSHFSYSAFLLTLRHTMRLRESLVRFWARLRGLVAATTPPPPGPTPTPINIEAIPAFPLPRPGYEVSLD